MQNILKTEVMTGLVQKFPPQGLMGLSMAPRLATSKITAQMARWDVMRSSRHLPEYNQPGAPAKREDKLIFDTYVAELAYHRFKKALDAQTLYFLRNAGDQYNVQAGEQRVRQELEDLNRLLDYKTEYMIWQMFTGTLAATQADVKFSVDYGIAVGHKPTTGTSWASLTTADPVSDIQAWKKLISRDSGEMPTDAYCNETVMNYMVNNTKVRELLRNQYGRQLVETGNINRMLGLNVHVYDNGYTPKGGSFTPFIGEDKFIIIAKGNPDPEGQVTNRLWDLLEGPSLDMGANGRPGKFSKSWMAEDPSVEHILVEHYALPVLFKPEAVIYADVVP